MIEKQSVNRKMITISLLIGAFFAILNETLLNIALVELMDVFNISAPTVQWMATGFMLVMGVVMPLSALIIQWFTTRQLFIGVLSIFTVGTLIAGLSVNFPMLLTGRMIQAVGTGLLIPVVMNTMLLIYEPSVRGRVMGFFGMVIMFAPALGPTLSGVIVDLFGWRYLFLLVVPFTLFAIYFGYRFLENVGEVTKPKIDWLSVGLSSFGIFLIIFSFSSIGNQQEGASFNPLFIAYIITGLVMLTLFVIRQFKLDVPILDFSVFKYKNYKYGTIIFIIVVMAMMASEIVMPMYLQGPMEFSAKIAGIILLPGALLNGLMSPVMGGIFDKLGPRKMIIPGTIVLLLVMFFYSTIHPGISMWVFILVYMVLMLAISATLMPANTNGMNELPESMYPHGTAIINTMQPIAGALGVSIFVTIMTKGKERALEGITSPTTEQVHMAMTEGIHYSYYFGMALVFIALLCSLRLTRATVGQSGIGKTSTDTTSINGTNDASS